MLLRRLRHKFVNILIRFCHKGRVFFYRRLATYFIEGRPILNQATVFAGKGRLIFGEKVALGYYPSPHFLSGCSHIEARNLAARIEIGDRTVINNNFALIADSTYIRIGKNCLIGANVEILDSDFHALEIEDRRQGKRGISHPVTILDDVFIGSNARILKGVTVGRGAVIANSAIVSKDVPEFTIVAGNPAIVIKKLKGLPDE